MARSSVTLASVAASFIAVCGCTAAASAVTNISQLRSVYAFTNNGGPNLTETSSQVGPWDRSVTSDGNLTTNFRHRASATLTSVISPTRFTALATIFAADDIQNTNAEARSRFEATFEVAAPTPYLFTGSWFVQTGIGFNPKFDAGMMLRRISPDPQVLYEGNATNAGGGDHGSVNLGGTLQPGVYEIVARTYLFVGISPGTASGTGDFNFDLIVPSPGAASMLLLGGVGVLGRRRRV